MNLFSYFLIFFNPKTKRVREREGEQSTAFLSNFFFLYLYCLLFPFLKYKEKTKILYCLLPLQNTKTGNQKDFFITYFKNLKISKNSTFLVKYKSFKKEKWSRLVFSSYLQKENSFSYFLNIKIEKVDSLFPK